MSARFSVLSLARRFSSSAARCTQNEVRQVLTSRIKDAMKSKNQMASTTLRGILSEVNNADKTASSPITSSAIIGIIRKAHARRTEAAAVFNSSSRPDLAEKELQEAALLNEFLPPLLNAEQIDNHVRDIVAGLSPEEKSPKAVGKIFKLFYAKVDKSIVDPNLVKDRVNALLSS